MAGLYFHIPFCRRICAYCDFYKSVGLGRMEELVAAMHRELEARREYLGRRSRPHPLFRGRNPVALLARGHCRAAGTCGKAVRLFRSGGDHPGSQPRRPDAPLPRGAAPGGVDRLSIGIQSFDDACLKLMNRRHNAAQAVQAVRDAQGEGFENITIDLIFGVPGFGGDSLRRTLDTAIGLDLQHISAYHLTIEPGTAFGRRAAAGSSPRWTSRSAKRNTPLCTGR